MTDADALDHDPEDAAPPPLTMEFQGKVCRASQGAISFAEILCQDSMGEQFFCQATLLAATSTREEIELMMANIPKAKGKALYFFDDLGVRFATVKDEAIAVVNWFWEQKKMAG